MSESAKFSVSMPQRLKGQIDSRQREGHPDAGDRSSVITRDLGRLYNGILKIGLRTLKQAHLTLEERACLATILSSTAFSDPDSIPYLVYSLEDSRPELTAFPVDPETFLAKIKALDTAALYALVDLLECDPTLEELA